MTSVVPFQQAEIVSDRHAALQKAVDLRLTEASRKAAIGKRFNRLFIRPAAMLALLITGLMQVVPPYARHALLGFWVAMILGLVICLLRLRSPRSSVGSAWHLARQEREAFEATLTKEDRLAVGAMVRAIKKYQ